MKRFRICLMSLSLLGCGVITLPANAQVLADVDQLKLTKQLSLDDLKESLKPSDEGGNSAKNTFNDEVLEITETDLWSRIRNGYAIPNLENSLVTKQTQWYGNRLDYLLRIIQRGSRYLYHVVDALEQRGMPTDLALLPFIESAFNPQAISSAKASGMWQFMPATGRDYNLRQNLFKDDRRGVLDSTEAALDYLQRLYGIFGDWQLALAAYNWGEGSVQRAIKRQQALGLPTDFDSLSARMPAETRNYVPKLQAVKNIIGNPEQFNLDLPKLENLPYFTTIRKERDIDVQLAAQLADIPLSEFKALNPQFNRPVITGANSTILLPINHADLFQQNLASWTGPLSSWTTLSVPKTERVESLATRFGYRAEVLREVNAIPAKMLVKGGSTLLVPKKAHAEDDNIPEHVAEQAQLSLDRGVKTRSVKHRVTAKDSVASLAKRYRVNAEDLRAWNQLKSDKLKVGQTLSLQVPLTNSGKRVAQKTRSGKQVASIAKTRPSANKKPVRQAKTVTKKPSSKKRQA